MHRLRTAAATLALCTTLTLSGPSVALIVYDPTNFTANIRTAMSEIQALSHDVTMIQNQVSQITQLAKAIESGNFSNIAGVMNFINTTVGLAERAEGLANMATDLDQTYRQTYEINWSDNAAASGGTSAPEGTTITWNDGSTSTVGANGKDQGGYEIKWNDGTSTYVRQPTAQTWTTQIHNTVRAAMQIQQGIQSRMSSHQNMLQGAMGASQSAVGALSAVQATNELLAVLSTQTTDMTQVLSSHARVVEQDSAQRAAAIDKASADRARWLRLNEQNVEPNQSVLSTFRQ